MDTEINTKPAAAALVEADGARRFLNFVIDAAIVVSLILIFNKFYFFLRILHVHDVFKVYDLALIFAYFYGLELSLGQTVGKMITKTKVVSEDGSKPSTHQLLVRTISRFIPLEPVLYIGGNWLHDSLSRTRVVFDNK
ncbi:MAG: RDD family protein [Bacteroidetes bacterium]|nr:RDD family protein [Bacteroidota bacterium]